MIESNENIETVAYLRFYSPTQIHGLISAFNPHECARSALRGFVITASVILSELGQIVCNLEPRSLAAHENMAVCAYTWVGVKGAQWESIDFRIRIELRMNT